MPFKQKHQNQLALLRKRNGWRQKQIAVLLNHKTSNQISRFERGAELPTLETALKLQIIFHLPLHLIFDQCFKTCIGEIAQQIRQIRSSQSAIDLNPDFEFCSYAESLKHLRVAEPELNRVRAHIAKLVKSRTERMNHSVEDRFMSESEAENQS